MNTISKEYLLLFNAITDAQQMLDHLRQTLLNAQERAEELYLTGGEELLQPKAEKTLFPGA